MARRFVLPVCVIAAAAALLALLAYGVGSHSDAASINAQLADGHYPPAPHYDTALPLLGSDRQTSLSAYRGRVVVMNVYASWCPPCQDEAPTMAREQTVLAREHVELVGVTYMDNSDATQAFNHRYGLRYPVLRDVSGTFVKSFGTDGVPETFVLSRQGRILALSRGPVTAQWFRRTLSPILAGHSPART